MLRPHYSRYRITRAITLMLFLPSTVSFAQLGFMRYRCMSRTVSKASYSTWLGNCGVFSPATIEDLRSLCNIYMYFMIFKSTLFEYWASFALHCAYRCWEKENMHDIRHIKSEWYRVGTLCTIGGIGDYAAVLSTKNVKRKRGWQSIWSWQQPERSNDYILETMYQQLDYVQSVEYTLWRVDCRRQRCSNATLQKSYLTRRHSRHDFWPGLSLYHVGITGPIGAHVVLSHARRRSRHPSAHAL